MAYRIAVLDDDTEELHKTEEMLSLYGETHPQNELEITCFQEIKPFMEAVCGGVREEWAFDILLMDVYLPDGNGIKSARVLREKGYEGVMIFKSSSREDAIEAYSVNALHYLVKPVSQKKFDRAMDKAVEELRRHTAALTKEEIQAQPAGGALDEKESGDGKFLGRMINMIKKILIK